LKILIACEFSGITREAFRAKGHEVFSCDFLDSEIPSDYHIKRNVLDILWMNWDMMITFPPCKYLAVSGAKWFDDPQRKILQQKALKFVQQLLYCDIPKICLENPVSIISTHIRKPDQIIHPWMFGVAEEKTTCLWLKNLPQLKLTNALPPPYHPRVHYEPPHPDRWKNRSRTLKPIAEAMANQWG
jgi:hypothetical protein